MLSLTKPEPKVVWSPIPGSSQELALDTRCNITLFHGTRGPGKTDTQLMRFRRRVGMGYGRFWRGVIFDRRYKNLDDLVSKAKRWFYEFGDGAEWLQATSQYKWVWPTGEELLFRSIEDSDSYYDYHGQEFPFIGWNELTKYPTPDLFDKMMSCNRSSWTWEKDAPIDKAGNKVPLEDIPLEVFATTNSLGSGHGWVKERFIDVAPTGRVVRTTIHVFNPKTQKEEDVVRSQVAIFGSYKENIYLDPIYIANLHQLCENDENLRKSWLEGSWDVVAGGAFSDVWKREIHVVPRFQVPLNALIVDRSFDWGSTAPFSIGWWFEATGEEITLMDGRTFTPVRGSLIRFHEYYGARKQESTYVGIRKSATWIAEKINEIETQLLIDEWVLKKPSIGPADSSIGDVKEDDVESIETKMAAQGVLWEKSDKTRGSRKNGLELMRDRLIAATRYEGPAIYFMEHCRHSIRTIPVLPRDEDDMDDVDTLAEDHIWDETRYRVLKGARKLPTTLPVKMVN